jgi:hypothetical protein
LIYMKMGFAAENIFSVQYISFGSKYEELFQFLAALVQYRVVYMKKDFLIAWTTKETDVTNRITFLHE